MDKPMTDVIQNKTREITYDGVKKEILRKSLHGLIALFPFIAKVNYSLAFMIIFGGIFLYSISEILRLAGRNETLLARITLFLSRSKESDKFETGPITLAIGAILALMLFPRHIATIAIFSLAFGDGIASIAGKKFSSISIPYTNGKTFAGSFACFMMIYVISFGLTMSVPHAFLIAVAGTFIEALPLRNMDNIVMPVGVGFVAYYLLV